MIEFIERFETVSKVWLWTIFFIGVVIIGVIDYFTGYTAQLGIFYLLPIAFIGWVMGRRSGFIAALIAAVVAILAEYFSHPTDLIDFIFAWNMLINLSFFVVFSFLLSGLKREHDRVKLLARTDYLTGAVSPGFFYDLLKIEIDRLQRYQHPFSLAYFGADNFKMINDSQGHIIGDRVLAEIVKQVKPHIRITDVIGRLGGDEFAVLFPETDRKGVEIVVEKFREALLSHMAQNQWSVTFSIGVATFITAPINPQEAIKIVDDLMYEVKHKDKDGVKYEVVFALDTTKS